MLLGCRPKGRNIEQHDVFFTIATSLLLTTNAIKEFWPESKGNIHIDAWREVTSVNGYSIKVIKVIEDTSEKKSNLNSLFFINLGGYKPGEWEEFHYKMLIVANNKEEAISIAKQTAFFKHTGFKTAPAHIDDKYGIDTDDVHEINDILSTDLKKTFSIEITQAVTQEVDALHIGYLPIFRISEG